MKKPTSIKATMIQTSLVACILLIASCGYNQKPGDTKEIAEDKNNAKFDDKKQERDAQFLVNAAEFNLEEIHLAKLAQQKGKSEHVRELGKMMEEAHAKSQNDLIALAKNKNISIPSATTERSNKAYKSLNEESADDFDEAYANRMVSNHKNAVDTFEDASEDSQDPDIKKWASATLPNLRKHLDRSIDSQKKFATMYLEQNK